MTIASLRTLCIDKLRPEDVLDFDPLLVEISSDLTDLVNNTLKNLKEYLKQSTEGSHYQFLKQIRLCEKRYQISISDHLSPQIIQILSTKLQISAIFSIISHGEENLSLIQKIIPHLTLSSIQLCNLMIFCINNSWVNSLEYLFRFALENNISLQDFPFFLILLKFPENSTLMTSCITYMEAKKIAFNQLDIKQHILNFLEKNLYPSTEVLFQYAKRHFGDDFQKDLLISFYDISQKYILKKKTLKLSFLLIFTHTKGLYFSQEAFEDLLKSCSRKEEVLLLWSYVEKEYKKPTQECLDFLFRQACAAFKVPLVKFLFKKDNFFHLIPLVLEDLFQQKNNKKLELEILLFNCLSGASSISAERKLELLKKGISHSFLQNETTLFDSLLNTAKDSNIVLEISFFEDLIKKLFTGTSLPVNIHENVNLLLVFIEENSLIFSQSTINLFIQKSCSIADQEMLLAFLNYGKKHHYLIENETIEQVFNCKSTQLTSSEREKRDQVLTLFFQKTQKYIEEEKFLKKIFFMALAEGFGSLFKKAITICSLKNVDFSQSDFNKIFSHFSLGTPSIFYALCQFLCSNEHVITNELLLKFFLEILKTIDDQEEYLNIYTNFIKHISSVENYLEQFILFLLTDPILTDPIMDNQILKMFLKVSSSLNPNTKIPSLNPNIKILSKMLIAYNKKNPGSLFFKNLDIHKILLKYLLKSKNVLDFDSLYLTFPSFLDLKEECPESKEKSDKIDFSKFFEIVEKFPENRRSKAIETAYNEIYTQLRTRPSLDTLD